MAFLSHSASRLRALLGAAERGVRRTCALVAAGNGPAARGAARPHRTRLTVETLEQRELLSATAILSGAPSLVAASAKTALATSPTVVASHGPATQGLALRGQLDRL